MAFWKRETMGESTGPWRFVVLVVLSGCFGTVWTARAEEPEEVQTDTGLEGRPEPDEAPVRVRRKPRTRVESELRFDAAVLGGAFSGLGVRPDSGPMSLLTLETRGVLDAGRVALRVPVDLQYRETYGVDLREFRTRLAPAVRVKPTKRFWVELGTGVDSVRRPGWLDLYQPIPEEPTDPPMSPEGYLPTDRFGYQAWHIRTRVGLRPARGQKVKAFYRYRLSTWEKDPSFHPVDDPDADPNHLVPGDNEEHRMGIRWRWSRPGFRFVASFIAYQRDYFYVFARDAGTGKTHASPGFEPANPLQQFRGIRPTVLTEFRFLDERLRCAASLGYDFVQDTFQGYYSYTAPRPGLRIRHRTPAGVEISATASFRFRRYGPNSYAETPGWEPGMSGHPPLTFGDRRVDARTTVSTGLRIPFGRLHAAVVQGDLWLRRTNFPDYQPGIFPSSSNYEIQWNYSNWRVLGGVETAW